MPLPVQTIFPGVLESPFRRESQILIAKNAVQRLWDKDPTLWPVADHHAESLKSNLAWLDLPGQLEPLMARVTARAAEIDAAGFEDVVFIAMGPSNLAAEAILRLPGRKLGKRSFLLDTIDPDFIRALEKDLHLDRTLFIFASKLGTDIENHSLLLYFLEKLKALGIASPAAHFVALTEQHSYLASIAKEYKFSDVFPDPPGIGGRYSSLIHFNFFLSAVGHFDMKDLIARTTAMAQACGPGAPLSANPALSLGAFLAAGETEHKQRLIFLSAESLSALTQRIGHLVGASTGKNRRGIIPILGGRSYPIDLLQRGCLVAVLKVAGEEPPEISQKLEQLRHTNVPIVSIELHGPEDFAAELFKWELATAFTCSLLGVDPFHDPEIRESRARTAQILERIATTHEFPSATARVSKDGLELYAEGETRQQISTLSIPDALDTFFALGNRDGYLALLPFLGSSSTANAALHRLQNQLVSSLNLPVPVTAGPLYLRGLGQVYKAGPANGLFILLTAAPSQDLPIPGAGYTFGQLRLALALGDFESLGRHHRPVIRLHLADGIERGLAQLEAVFASALAKRRRGSP